MRDTLQKEAQMEEINDGVATEKYDHLVHRSLLLAVWHGTAQLAQFLVPAGHQPGQGGGHLKEWPSEFT